MLNKVLLNCLLVLLTLGGCTLASDSRTARDSDTPPNGLRHSPSLMTSGQPPARWFASEEAAQFQVIVHLRATKSADLSFNESSVAGHHRRLYVLQAIDFDQPREEDLVTFLRLMSAFDGLSIQVHCQLNMIASSMVFLYEVIEGKRDALVAYDDVLRVWSPNSVWQDYFRSSLGRRGIDFDPH